MTTYLQEDGIDDWLNIPSIAETKLILDIMVSSDSPNIGKVMGLVHCAGNFNVDINADKTVTYNSTKISSVLVDGVSVSNNTQFIPFDKRFTLTLIYAPSQVNYWGIQLFTGYNGGGNHTKGNIYSVIGYVDTKIVGSYDMSTGTVNDQSGNGKNATLNGGTFVDDGTGGGTEPVGVDVSYTYGMKQVIYSDRTVQAPTKQSIYADRSSVVPLAQNVFANRQYQFAIKQAVYADRSWSYPMLQQIFSDYVLYSASFPLRQVISKDVAFSYPLKQAIWQSKSSSFPIKQKIYRNVSFQAPMKQIVYADIVQAFPLMQVVWTEKSWDYAMKQVIFDPDSLIIGHILLRGDRVLSITLEGSRELNIQLRGGLVTTKNQNFPMVAGDTKYLDVPVDFDLTQAQEIKWGLYKLNQQLIYKSLTDDSITITKSGAENEFQIKLDPEDTIDLRGSYDHEAEVKDAIGNVSTVMEGTATITRSLV